MQSQKHVATLASASAGTSPAGDRRSYAPNLENVWILEHWFNLCLFLMGILSGLQGIPGQKTGRFSCVEYHCSSIRRDQYVYIYIYIDYIPLRCLGVWAPQFFREAKPYTTSPHCSLVSQYGRLKWFLLLPDRQNIPNKVALRQPQCWEQALGTPHFLENDEKVWYLYIFIDILPSRWSVPTTITDRYKVYTSQGDAGWLHWKVITSYSTTMGNYLGLPAPTSFPRIHLTHNMIIYIIIYIYISHIIIWHMTCSVAYNEPTRKGCPESRKNPKLLASHVPWQLLGHQAVERVGRWTHQPSSRFNVHNGNCTTE